MSWGVVTSPQNCSVVSITPRIPSIIRRHCCSVIPLHKSSFSSSLKPFSCGLLKLPFIDSRCRSSTGGSGENESKTILDAFFLGKALGEALNERIESSVGEFLSIVGRLQAEQQKQLFVFQEEVLEKARRAKEQASREAMEAREIFSTDDRVSATKSSVSYSVISTASPSVSKPTDEDPLNGLLKD